MHLLTLLLAENGRETARTEEAATPIVRTGDLGGPGIKGLEAIHGCRFYAAERVTSILGYAFANPMEAYTRTAGLTDSDGPEIGVAREGMGFLYVISNPAMPGLVKIGQTSRHPNARLEELYSTGTPSPFHLEFATEVTDPKAAERTVHEHFSEQRETHGREFFRVSASQARDAILRVASHLIPDEAWVTGSLLARPETDMFEWPQAEKNPCPKCGGPTKRNYCVRRCSP